MEAVSAAAAGSHGGAWRPKHARVPHVSCDALLRAAAAARDGSGGSAAAQDLPLHVSEAKTLLHAECGLQDDGGFGVWQRVVVPRVLSDDRHDFTDVAGCVFDGAGILPVMQPPGDTTTYFLLGCKAFNPAFSLTGGRWTLFGGRPMQGETDTTATAAREFIEETAGLVCWGDGVTNVVHSATALATSLKAHEFIICCRLRYVRDGRKRFYDVFVKRMPWDPAAPQRFAAFQEACREQQGALWVRACRDKHPALHASTHTLRPEYAELSELGIWSKQHIQFATQRGGGMVFDRRGNAMLCRTILTPILALCLQQLAVLHRGRAAAAAKTTTSDALDAPRPTLSSQHTASYGFHRDRSSSTASSWRGTLVAAAEAAATAAAAAAAPASPTAVSAASNRRCHRAVSLLR